MGKIYLGEQDKLNIINSALDGVTKVFVIGDELNGILHDSVEHIRFPDTIMYKYFYRLLQEINPNTMLVLNECLKKQNRYDLAYNCIRRYALQTDNLLVFNYYPILWQQEDFMILYDMIQNNPFLKESYKYITRFKNVELGKVEFNLTKVDLQLLLSQEQYEEEKGKIIEQVKKDADIIPRRLYKFVCSYKQKKYDDMRKIKKDMVVGVSQFGVDKYYYNELLSFERELDSVIQRISE